MEHISFFKPSDVVVEKIKNSCKKEYCDFSPIHIQTDDETNESEVLICSAQLKTPF